MKHFARPQSSHRSNKRNSYPNIVTQFPPATKPARGISASTFPSWQMQIALWRQMGRALPSCRHSFTHASRQGWLTCLDCILPAALSAASDLPFRRDSRSTCTLSWQSSTESLFRLQSVWHVKQPHGPCRCPTTAEKTSAGVVERVNRYYDPVLRASLLPYQENIR